MWHTLPDDDTISAAEWARRAKVNRSTITRNAPMLVKHGLATATDIDGRVRYRRGCTPSAQDLDTMAELLNTAGAADHQRQTYGWQDTVTDEPVTDEHS